MQFWNRLSSPCILHRYKRLHFHSTNKSSKSKDSNQIMGIFSSNFLQNLKLFWQFVGNFDKQCFLIISHKRISFFVVYFHWTFPDSYWIFRFIYWNSHFYGSNFYGWSIGDLKSLTESGPFHSQGEQSCSLEITLFNFQLKAGTAWAGKTLFWLVSLRGITFWRRGEDREGKVWVKD